MFKSKAKYIVVRDMFLPKKLFLEKADYEDIEKIKQKTYSIYESFMWHNGKIKTKRDLYHFLLKYRYQENWNREVKENYFPLCVEDFLAEIDKKFELVYFKTMQVPFIVDTVKRDFGIDIVDDTHVEMIFRRI